MTSSFIVACLLIGFFNLQFIAAHEVKHTNVDERAQILTKILGDIDDHMDKLMELIDIIGDHGAECTYYIPTYIRTSRHHHPNESNNASSTTSRSPQLEEADEPSIILENWLEEIEKLRQEIARNHFLSKTEQTIIHLFRTVLDNAIIYAAHMKKDRNEPLRICNRDKFLTCNYTEPTYPVTPSPDDHRWPTIKGKCICYSRNDSDCDPEENSGDIKTQNMDRDEELFEKSKCHALRRSIHTRYIPELDMCMLAEQAFCPISPSYLMCEPGLTCSTVDNHRHCDMDNVAPLFGNLLGRKTVAFDYTRVPPPVYNPRRDAEHHDKHDHHHEEPTSTALPEEITDASKNETLWAEMQREIKRHYVMRRIATNDIFCRCHKLYNCRDSKIGCKGDCLHLNVLLIWIAIIFSIFK